MLTNFAIIASFISPENIGTNPVSMIWLFPLASAIAVVYKATKLPTITTGNFIKEVLPLLGSIIVFLGATALVLYGLVWFITE
ncbi:MAG: hypothetical protein KAS75_08765 [Planctomycetes bacterium]|nr:hypothetical protein [Planctomycetota bacterium]